MADEAPTTVALSVALSMVGACNTVNLVASLTRVLLGT
jgi:hypothetical protein